MYLKSIEVHGFKSFAHKLKFDFHNGITGIVGPNGSGKSNVADAVRWVLGEQRIKQLRGGTMQDVIFSGTENRKPLSYASVAITLDNSDHQLPIDYEEVTVTRKLYRSGESEYLINGSTCRLKDVNELFYDTGIGKEGYSIIGQGQIDKILSGKPEERRELFDEAAGIVKFKRRKNTSVKKLEEERQNLLRVNDILAELEKQIGPLERQSEKAREYLKKKEALKTYDINMPGVVAIYLKGEPRPGVGPQDVALAIIGEVFANGYVKNKVMEFVGPGVANLSADFRIGIDVMTTETTCLSSIWQTDAKIEEFYAIHGRPEDYKELKPGNVAYYDGCVEIDLGEIKPMIAMPFHPSNTYTIDELKANLDDILADVEKRAQVSLDGKIPFTLRDKVIDGQLYVEQGIIAGCAGGGFENICAAADILKGKNIGHDAFTLSVYPASTPIYMELAKNGVLAELIGTGAVVKTAFCGPCFGAGDTPANNAFSIRHTTRNFPNREGSKIQNGQISSVALMDARSIAATAANKGFLTSAEEFDGSYSEHKYYFDKSIYENRVFDSKGVADPSVEIQFGPNIKDWPEMAALADNLILKVVSEIHDPVTTTDELIPSGETSSYRSNPLGLAEFTLSRKDPEYVGRAKAIQAAQKAIQAGNCPVEAVPELKPVLKTINKTYPEVDKTNLGVGSTIFAVKPGDGSAREQAASCQKVLGGWANIANEYATKRYRSNLINWGMLPFLIPAGDLPFKNGDFLFFPGIRKAVEEKADVIKGYTVEGDSLKEFEVTLGELTDDEREIILKGCLINYNRK